METIHESLTPELFLALLEKKGLVLVDFYATWCEPCKMLDQILQELAPELEGVANILKLDIDLHPLLKAEHTIMSVPTLMVFKNGSLQWRMPGFMLQHELKEKVLSFR